MLLSLSKTGISFELLPKLRGYNHVAPCSHALWLQRVWSRGRAMWLKAPVNSQETCLWFFLLPVSLYPEPTPLTSLGLGVLREAWGAGLHSDTTSVYWAPYRMPLRHRIKVLSSPSLPPATAMVNISTWASAVYLGGTIIGALYLSVTRTSVFLTRGFSDRTWDSYFCSPGRAIQKRRELTLMGPPKTDGAKEPLVHKMSSETYSVSYSERSLEWTPSAHGRSQLDNALGQAFPLSVSPLPHPTPLLPETTPPMQTSAQRLFFRTCSGSRLRQAPALHQTFSSFPALNLDGSAMACLQSSLLPSGPCNKNRREEAEWPG